MAATPNLRVKEKPRADPDQSAHWPSPPTARVRPESGRVLPESGRRDAHALGRGRGRHQQRTFSGGSLQKRTGHSQPRGRQRAAGGGEASPQTKGAAPRASLEKVPAAMTAAQQGRGARHVRSALLEPRTRSPGPGCAARLAAGGRHQKRGARRGHDPGARSRFSGPCSCLENECRRPCPAAAFRSDSRRRRRRRR